MGSCVGAVIIVLFPIRPLPELGPGLSLEDPSAVIDRRDFVFGPKEEGCGVKVPSQRKWGIQERACICMHFRSVFVYGVHPFQPANARIVRNPAEAFDFSLMPPNRPA